MISFVDQVKQHKVIKASDYNSLISKYLNQKKNLEDSNFNKIIHKKSGTKGRKRKNSKKDNEKMKEKKKEIEKESLLGSSCSEYNNNNNKDYLNYLPSQDG